MMSGYDNTAKIVATDRKLVKKIEGVLCDRRPSKRQQSNDYGILKNIKIFGPFGYVGSGSATIKTATTNAAVQKQQRVMKPTRKARSNKPNNATRSCCSARSLRYFFVGYAFLFSLLALASMTVIHKYYIFPEEIALRDTPLLSSKYPSTWSLAVPKVDKEIVDNNNKEEREVRRDTPQEKPLLSSKYPSTWSLAAKVEEGIADNKEKREARDTLQEPLLSSKYPSTWSLAKVDREIVDNKITTSYAADSSANIISNNLSVIRSRGAYVNNNDKEYYNETICYHCTFKGDKAWTRLRNMGFGTVMSIASDCFVQSTRAGYKFHTTVSENGWLYSRGVCPEQDLSCYFEPHPVDAKPKNQREAMHMMMKPKPEIQTSINKRLQEFYNGKKHPPYPCGVLHIRHSDTLLNYNGNNSRTPIFKYLNVADYLGALDHHSISVKDIILLTDDQDVIDDVNQNYRHRDDIRWHYLDRKRFRGTEGGYENHFPSGNRRQEVIDILTIRSMVAPCDVWVGTSSFIAKMWRMSMHNNVTIININNRVPETPWSE